MPRASSPIRSTDLLRGTVALAVLIWAALTAWACGGGGSPTESCGGPSMASVVVTQGKACGTGNTPRVTVTNRSCSPINLLTADEKLIGLSGQCKGDEERFIEPLSLQVASNDTVTFDLQPWTWCCGAVSPCRPAFECDFHQEIVIVTSGPNLFATSNRFTKSFNANCEPCSSGFFSTSGPVFRVCAETRPLPAR